MKTLYTLAAALAVAFGAFHPAGRAMAQEKKGVIVIPSGQGRVYAVEDSIPDPQSALTTPEIKVSSTRVPLREIIRKARDGERQKYAGLKTMAYSRTLRVVMTSRGDHPTSTCDEIVQRVYYRAPSDWAMVTLQDTTYELGSDGKPLEKKKDEKVRLKLSTGRRQGLRDLAAELPFYLEKIDSFRFHIAHKSINQREVLYEVDFEPMSDFDRLPGGRLWLLTPNYQIVREEFRMKNIPFPWIIKNIDLLTREWEEVEGRWVEKRLTGRVDIGRLMFVDIPGRIEFVVSCDHYRFDPELDNRLFGGGGR